jgi:diacylglycerol kinase (ATP)
VETASKRVLLVHNPISGRPKIGRQLRRIRQAITQGGFELDEQVTRGPGDATALATATPEDTRAVLVYGGDGTVREAAAGLVGRSVPIYHLPGGNENLVAKHFGMSLKPRRLIETLQRRQTRTIDVVGLNGIVCAACFGIGFDAEVVRVVAERRRGHCTDLNYMGPILQTVLNYQFPVLEVQSQGRTVFSGQGMVFAGNLTRYGAGIPLFKRAIDDDGLLDVVIFPCKSRRGFLYDVGLTLLGKHYDHKNVIFLRTSQLSVSGDAGVASQVDGDMGPPLPLQAAVRPRALNVLLP